MSRVEQLGGGSEGKTSTSDADDGAVLPPGPLFCGLSKPKFSVFVVGCTLVYGFYGYLIIVGMFMAPIECDSNNTGDSTLIRLYVLTSLGLILLTMALAPWVANNLGTTGKLVTCCSVFIDITLLMGLAWTAIVYFNLFQYTATKLQCNASMITCIIWPLHLVLTLLVVNLWRKCAQPKPPGEEGKKMVHWAADYGGIHEFDSENSDTKTLSSSQPSSMISLSSPVDDQDPVSEGGFRRHSGSVSAHKRSFSSPNKQSGSRITRLNTPSRSMGMMNMDEIALTDEFANPLSPGQSQGPDRHGWRGSGSVVRVHNNNNNNNNNNNGGESGSRSPLHVKRHSNSSSSNHATTVQHHQQQQRIQSPVIPYKLDILKKKKHSRSKPA